MSQYDGTNSAHLVMKMDWNGIVLWTKAYHFDEIISSGSSLVASEDGGFIISGTGRVLPNTKIKSFVYKIDSSGSFVWGVRSQDSTGEMTSGRVLLTSSGDVYLGGYIRDPSTNKIQNFLLQLDSVGTIGWMKSYWISGQNLAVQQFAIGSESIYWCKDYYHSGWPQYVVIGKADLAGTPLLSVKHETDTYEEVEDIIVDNDGNVVVLSYINLPPNYKDDIALLKLTPSL